MLWEEAASLAEAIEAYVDKRIALAEAARARRVNAGPGLQQAMAEVEAQAGLARTNLVAAIAKVYNTR
jgi:hypothetical protein